MGLLGDIFSFGNKAKKSIRGLLDDPMGYTNQVIGMLSDDAKTTSERQKRMVHNPASITVDDVAAAMNSASALAPMGITSKAPRAEAMRIAQQNAAKPISEGGLGLRPDNTPMERARAMGFEGGWYHGTTHDFTQFGGKTHSKEGHLGAGHYFTNNPMDASVNYAGVGPDLTVRLEKEAEDILSRKGVDWRGADDPAYLKAMDKARQKLKGETEGLVIPAMVRSKKTIDISPNSKDLVDFTPKMNKEGEFIDDNKNVSRMFSFLQKKGVDPQEALQNIDLYDVMRASELDKGLRQSEPLMYADDAYGNLVGNDLIRGLYKSLGYDAVKMDAKAAFPNMKNIPDATQHLIVNNPNQIRSRFAAFDPARRHEADLLGQVNPELLPWLIGGGLLGGYGVKQAQE